MYTCIFWNIWRKHEYLCLLENLHGYPKDLYASNNLSFNILSSYRQIKQVFFIRNNLFNEHLIYFYFWCHSILGKYTKQA